MGRPRPSRHSSSSTNKNQRSSRSGPSANAHRYFVESLEERRLFVVLHGGDVFEFFANNSFYERVVVTGNTTVELIGGRENPNIGTMQGFSLTPMQGVIFGPDAQVYNGGFVNAMPPGGATPIPYVDSIYAMYVSQSDINSGISVAMVPDLMTPGPRPMLPYQGSIGSVRVTPTIISNVQAPLVVPAPDGSGMALLGAQTINAPMGMNQDLIPINVPVPAGTFTTAPPGLLIPPGLTVAPGNDLGTFLFGGTIMGQVNIHGSIDQFYCGWLLTGNSGGEQDVGIISIPHNFNVDGDLRNLIVSGEIGTQSDAVGATPDYVTGFDLHVGGRLGQVTTPGSLVGNVDVTNSPTAPNLANVPYDEIELRGPAGFDAWDNAQLGTPQGPDLATFLHNDTFNTAQFIGPQDASGSVTVNGEIDAEPGLRSGPDFVDYYAVPLMAGQTITVQLNEPTNMPSQVPGQLGLRGFLDCGVFDPDGRLTATDYNTVDPSQTQGQPFQFTADRPGVYRFAVAQTSNNNFDATPAGSIVLQVVPYSLELSGLGNLAVSGIVAGDNILDDAMNAGFTQSPGQFGVLGVGFHVATGDLGAVVAGYYNAANGVGAVISNDQSFGNTTEATDPTGVITFGVDNGNLRTVQGAEIGMLFGAGGATYAATATTSGAGGTRLDIGSSATVGATFAAWPTALVPRGSIGLLSATAVSTGAMRFGLAWNLVVPTGTELSHEASAQLAIGGDYQLVSANDYFAGDLITNQNIGTIRAFDMATSPASYLQVNASYNQNQRNTIDLIDVPTFIGDLADGGPGITTGPGGDVRYIHIGQFGNIYRDAFFGGGEPETTPYQPGEVANITDDSGTQVTLTPVGGQLAAGSTPGNATYSNPAQLFVETYPIRGSGGAAIVRVETTDGISITSAGDGDAEIGTLLVDGPGTTVTNNNTIQAGNNPATMNGGGGTSGANGGGTTSTGTGSGTGTGINAGGGGTGVTTGGGSGTTTFPGAGQPGGPPLPRSTTGYKLPALPAPPTISTTGTPLTIALTGPGRIDTYEIASPSDPAGVNSNLDESLLAGDGNVTSIVNSTGGEIVNIHLPSVGTITTSGTLGMAVSHTAAAVLGQLRNPLNEDKSPLGNPWDYPFLQPRTMIRILGDIVSIDAPSGIANVYAGFIVHSPPGDFGVTPGPNVSLRPPPFVGTPEDPAGSAIMSGIGGNIGSVIGPVLGPVVAAGSVTNITANRLSNTSYAFGPHGSGAVGGGGIFAVGRIGSLVSNGDFLGDSVSTTGQLAVTVNGVISNGVISNFTRFDYAEARVLGHESPNTFPNPISLPTVDIGSITVNGNGGIIGTYIAGDHLGPILVANTGFGFFDSYVSILGEGTLQSLTVGGYGIRSSTLNGGANIGPIVVNGDGRTLTTTGFPSTVRQSEAGGLFDPLTGLPLSFLNDIDTYLGTVTGTHAVPGVSDTGVIENSTFLGSRSLNSVDAWSIRGRSLNVGSVFIPDPSYHPNFTVQQSSFNFANNIGAVRVRGPVNGFETTTGRTSKFSFGGDVAALNMTVAGPIGNLVFSHSLLSDSFINANGPNGKIGSIVIHGSLDGGIRATRQIGRVTIDGNLVGTIQAVSLGTLKLGGGIGAGSLSINSNVGTIQTVGDFGTTGSSLVINGTLGKLLVGGNMNGALTVTRNLNNLTVNGSVLTGTNVEIGGILRLLKVGGDVQAGATIHAQILKRQIVKGRTLGTIVSP